MKVCEYEKRDMFKCQNYKVNKSDCKLCYWQQKELGTICTWDKVFMVKQAPRPRSIGAYRVDTY